MQTIIHKTSKVSLYILADDVPIELNEATIEVGRFGSKPPRMVIADLNSSNGLVVKNVMAPEDWRGGKYIYDGEWKLNPEYIEPE